jgi:hypothetical protein
MFAKMTRVLFPYNVVTCKKKREEVNARNIGPEATVLNTVIYSDFPAASSWIHPLQTTQLQLHHHHHLCLLSMKDSYNYTADDTLA